MLWDYGTRQPEAQDIDAAKIVDRENAPESTAPRAARAKKRTSTRA
jgi:hypothetical protein